MSVFDWCIVIFPVLAVLGMALFSRRYVRGVVDYLAAGRVAGRYALSVSDLETALGVAWLVSNFESKYQTGFALAFWGHVLGPVTIILSLTGFCVYRYRETKALSMGQFLEMRYNRGVRILASILRTVSSTVTYAIGPAITANFLIFFLNLPYAVNLFGFVIPTYVFLSVLVVVLALVVIWPAGRVSLLVTDCVQGLMSYPIFVTIVIFIACKFSWNGEIAPVMLDRVPGESFLSPFDISKLRDFNVFAVIVMIFSRVLNRGSNLGINSSSCGRTPHEQKMAGVLSAWRKGLSTVMIVLIAAAVFTVMNHHDFAATAHSVRLELLNKVSEQLVRDSAVRAKVNAEVAKVPMVDHRIGVDKPLSRTDNNDTPYLNAMHRGLQVSGDQQNHNFQKMRTIYNQMMMPIAMRRMLPAGLTGLFMLLVVMLMISTDDSQIFNSASIIVQDLVMPFRSKPFTPKGHLRVLKAVTLVVAAFFLAFTLLFKQLDYIDMFINIMSAIWLGGAGPVVVFGLYSRFGTTAGAFASLILGSGSSICGVLIQRNWADVICPFLQRHDLVAGTDHWLRLLSAPFYPYVDWKMSFVKCPVNSYEFWFVSMLIGLLAYVVVSLLTCRKPYNLEQMLHRGKYAPEGAPRYPASPWTWRNVFNKLIGITPEYTKGDRIIAWCLFFHSIVYGLVFSFIGVAVWNVFFPWQPIGWSWYYLITTLGVGTVIGLITTVWFFIGGIVDLKRLFKDLALRKDNPLDNGWVEGNVSLADKEAFAKLDPKAPER